MRSGSFSILIWICALSTHGFALALSSVAAESAANEPECILYRRGGSRQPTPGSISELLLTRSKSVPVSTLQIDERPKIIAEDQADGSVFSAELTGKIELAGLTTLLINGTKTPLLAQGKFYARVPLAAEAQTIRIVLIDSHGKTFEESVVLEIPRYPFHLKRHFANTSKSKSQPALIGVGTGATYYRYRETGIDFTETALVAKISLQRKLTDTSPFFLGLSTFFTFSVLSTTETTRRTISFIGANARLGYQSQILKAPWRLSFAGGAYFYTTSSSDGNFGWQNLMGPQLYPVLGRDLGKRDSLSSYVKYSPISSGGLQVKFSNSELASGVSWTRLIWGGTPLILSFDYAHFKASFEGITFDCTSFSGGLGIGF